MMPDDDDDGDYEFPVAPWLHLLSAQHRAWREEQHLRGRDPDGYIEQQLRDAGQWPEDGSPKDA